MFTWSIFALQKFDQSKQFGLREMKFMVHQQDPLQEQGAGVDSLVWMWESASAPFQHTVHELPFPAI